MSAPVPLRVVRNDDYMTPGQHLLEARRLLLLADARLRGEEVTPADQALFALAHAVTALAADALGQGR